MPHTAYVALGSNLGDRQQNLARAVDAIGSLPGTRVLAVAPAISTRPIDMPAGAGDVLNSAAAIETTLEPLALLRALLAIEATLGRTRDGEVNASRPIDLDLLLFEDRVLDTPELTLPHPRMHRRRFVLAPLAAIAPDVVHPTKRQTIATLLAELQAD